MTFVIAADEVVAAAKETMTLCESSRTHGVINSHVIPTLADLAFSTGISISSRARSITSWKPP